MGYLYCDGKKNYQSLLDRSNTEQQKNARLADENNKMYASLTAAQEQNESLQQSLKGEQQKYANAVAAHKTQVAKLNEQLALLRKQMENATSDANLKAQLEDINRQLTEKEAALNAAQEQITALDGQITELQMLNSRIAQQSIKAQAYSSAIGKSLGLIDAVINLCAADATSDINIENQCSGAAETIAKRLSDMRAVTNEFRNQPWYASIDGQIRDDSMMFEGKMQEVRRKAAVYNQVYFLVGKTKDLLNAGILAQLNDDQYLLNPEGCRSNIKQFTAHNRADPTLQLPISSSQKFSVYPNNDPSYYHLSNAQNQPSQRILNIVNSDAFWRGKYVVLRLE